MGAVTYDPEKLADNAGIDTGVVSRFFYTKEDYFTKLKEFSEHYETYLTHYNPTVVVVSEAERDLFITDCANVRALLTQLGMNPLIDELNNMENAAVSGEIERLSDGILKFRGMLEIMARHIRSAEV